jgi:hypothetical protein
MPYRYSGFTTDQKLKTAGYYKTQCSARLRGVTSQKTVIFIVSEMRISNLTNIRPIDSCRFKRYSLLYMQLNLNHTGEQHFSLRYASTEFYCAFFEDEQDRRDRVWGPVGKKIETPPPTHHGQAGQKSSH